MITKKQNGKHNDHARGLDADGRGQTTNRESGRQAERTLVGGSRRRFNRRHDNGFCSFSLVRLPGLRPPDQLIIVPFFRPFSPRHFCGAPLPVHTAGVLFCGEIL